MRAFALVDRETIPDERDPTITTETIRLHRLVRQVTAQRYDSIARAEALGALIEAMTEVCPKGVFDDPATWPRARHLDAIALALVGADAELPDRSPPASYLLDRLGSYRHGALGAYAAARPLFERGLAIREKALGPDHPDIAVSLNNLATLLYAQGEFATARPLFERGLAIREKALGPDHPNTLASAAALADCLGTLAQLGGEQPDAQGAAPKVAEVKRRDRLSFQSAGSAQEPQTHAHGPRRRLAKQVFMVSGLGPSDRPGAEREKGKDRKSIHHYPDLAARADCRIGRSGKGKPPVPW